MSKLAHARENLSKTATIDNLKIAFASGAFRSVMMAHYTARPREGEECVAKRFHTGSVFESEHWKHDIAVVEKALDIVKQFNEAEIINKPIKVNRASVWKGTTPDIMDEKFLVEPFIEHWQKWNSNTGWALNDDEWSEIMQALSHFSFHAMKGQLVLCDLQGGIYEDGAVISDPVIVSRKREYGPTDLGIDGVLSFFHIHECNQFCRKSWVKPGGRPSGKLLVPEGTSMELSWALVEKSPPPGGAPLDAPIMHGRKKLTKEA